MREARKPWESIFPTLDSVVFSIVMALAAYLGRENPYFVYPEILWSFLVLLVFNLANLSLFPRRFESDRRLTLSVAANSLCIAVILYYSGGSQSYFWVMYLLPFFTASISFSPGKALAVQAGCLVLLGLFYSDSLRQVVWVEILEMLIKMSTLIIAAVVTMRVAMRERRTRHLLIEEAAVFGQASPKFLQAVCESVGWEFGVIWDVDRQAQVLRCSEVWHVPAIRGEEFESITRETVLEPGVGLAGRVWADGKPSWTPDMAAETGSLRDASAVKAGLRGAFAMPIASGGPVFGVIEFLSRQIQQPDEQLIQILAVAAGRIGQLTERQRVAEELGKARDAALKTARVKSEFLANMSHELRTPLNAVIGMTGLLLESGLTPAQREIAETVRTSGDTLLAIINDVLDFSKIEAGKMKLETMDFDVCQVVESAVEILALRAQAKGIELVAVIPPEIPGALRGDSGKLRQILVNLVGNGVKFTERGEVVVRVEKEAETGREAALRISVSDTGVGIAPEALKRLFKPFSQAEDSTTRKYGGTGLGLAISKHLVEIMGGGIGVESELGKGSRFWFRIRLETPSRPGAKPVREEIGGLRVLLVGQNETSREIIGQLLASWRMRCGHAGSASEALSILGREAEGENPYRLALVDLPLPHMEGPALARAIKADPRLPSLRVILLTAMGRALPEEIWKEVGIDACLAKPVKQSSLLDAISRVMLGKEAEAVSLAEENHPPKREHFRVLVVEDNSVNQRIALMQLQKLGYAADGVGNGKEALEALSRIPYDLVFMDCQMPEMDGYEATAELRRREDGTQHTLVIAMTASAREEDRRACLEAGMDDYISKPVRMEDLSKVLARWDAPVDESVLGELEKLAGAQWDMLVSRFLEDARARLSEIEKAVSQRDERLLKQAAHTLKGCSGNMGARRLRALCIRLEASGCSGANGTREVLAALEAEFERVRAALAKERKP